MVSTPESNEERRRYKSFPKRPVQGKLAVQIADQIYEIDNFKRIDCPITLNPAECTFEDVALHGILRQRLSSTTVEKRLRYAKFMENHSIPINFSKPNYEQFIRHMDYRETYENAGACALHNEWLAMSMFLKAYGFTWKYRPPIRPEHNEIILPFPETVRELIHHNYFEDAHLTKTVQYIMFHNFIIGWRVPSEPCNMTIECFHDDNNRGTLTITESKKHRRKRTIVPEKTVMFSRYRKSFKNYLDRIRPKVENQHSGNAFYLTSGGKPFTPDYLRKILYEAGTQVWEEYHPNISRHWSATARYIEWRDIYKVAQWHGHKNINRTANYIHLAEQYYQQEPKSWLKAVLRSR
jgi:integrase